MKILSAAQIKAADSYTIQHRPISSTDLMEQAATVFFNWFTQQFEPNLPVILYCGIGNNGGDGLVTARLLFEKGYTISVYIARYANTPSADFKVNEERLKNLPNLPVNNLNEGDPLPEINKQAIIIDALWGSGLSRPISGYWETLINHINCAAGTKVAIDVPSGLYADKPSEGQQFKAHYTFSFELPKLAFLFADNAPTVGKWHIEPIGLDKNFIDNCETAYYYFTAANARQLIKPRATFSHKGTYGHALIVAGSYGKMGAAALAIKACLKSGAGLVSAYIPKCGYTIIQTSLPEAMVLTDESLDYLSEIVIHENTYNAIGIGPGIGKNEHTTKALKHLIGLCKQAIVLDADALNILSKNKAWLDDLPINSILSPHPKEFERLFGKTANSFERLHLAIQKAKQYSIIIIIKGAYTATVLPNGTVFFNSSGNPGMATAGSGDVLTGLLTGLLAQGYLPHNAATLGVYLHGLAGDTAANNLSEPALIAGDIIDNIATAYIQLANTYK